LKGRWASPLFIRYEREPFAEVFLRDFFFGAGSLLADYNSNPERVDYLDLMKALTPNLVRLDFFHL
jgi:hypothetical protein